VLSIEGLADSNRSFLRSSKVTTQLAIAFAAVLGLSQTSNLSVQMKSTTTLTKNDINRTMLSGCFEVRLYKNNIAVSEVFTSCQRASCASCCQHVGVKRPRANASISAQTPPPRGTSSAHSSHRGCEQHVISSDEEI
jgi:hypothetical protein